MTKHINPSALNATLSRRQVMIGAAGLTFAFALSGKAARAAVAASERVGKAINPWLSIAPDGTITIMSAATEMGQGSMTSLPLILAEELDADWSKVRIVPVPPIDRLYANPAYGMIYTAGSNAVRVYYRPLRMFGAQARRVLLDNAAKRLGVPVEELTTEPSVVVHAKSGRRLGYGEIAAFAEIPDKAPEITPAQLKKPSEFRLIGKDVMRVEVPSKVNGRRSTPSTCRCPACSTARCCARRWRAQAPSGSTTPRRAPSPAWSRSIRLPYGVGVVAETPWAAFDGKRALAGECHLEQDRHGLGF